MCTLIVENLYNFGAHQIIEISLVLVCALLVYKNLDKIVFYINNDINLDQFNKLYNWDQIEKGIVNANIIICKLRLVLTSLTNQRFEVIKEERWKKKMIEKRKIKAMAAKC